MSVNYKNLGKVIEDFENRLFMANIVARSMADGVAPWGKPLPRSISTGQPIAGAARFALTVLARLDGVRGRHWGHLSEWIGLGRNPLLDCAVALFLDHWEGDRRVLEAAALYPSDAVPGIVEEPGAIRPDYTMADRIFDASGCRLKRRCVKPKWRRVGNLDWIEMPHAEDMLPNYWVDGYYSLLFHEMAHWVVLGGRLGDVQDMPVHQNEFLTNLAAAIVCDRCDIPFLLPISTKHGTDQIRGLKNPDYLFASNDIAQRAADFILKWEK